MANACFRCRKGIESGKTFCRECSQEVSLEDILQPTIRETRVWLAIGVPAVLLLPLLIGVPVSVAITGSGSVAAGALAAGMSGLFLAIPISYGLIKDSRHIRERHDTEWIPSKGNYWLLAFLTMFVFPAPLIAAYHLRRRRETIGLAFRRSSG